MPVTLRGAFGDNVFGGFVFGGEPMLPPAAVQAAGVAAIGTVGAATITPSFNVTGVAATGSAGLTIFAGQIAIQGVAAQAMLGTLTDHVQRPIAGVSAKGVADDVLKFEYAPAEGLAGWSGFIRRDGDDYAHASQELLPRGQAWPREPDSTLMRTIDGLAQSWGFVDSRAADLLEIESDPRKTVELLPDWERAWGLPDPCLPVPSTEELRRKTLVWKITLFGGQSRQWFYQFAREIVGTKIYIQEFAPYVCGLSQCGDTRPGPEGGWEEGHYRWEIGKPEIRFYWRVQPLGKTLHWFRCGRDNCGEDPLCKITPDVALECILTRLKPAQTEIVFDYSLSTIE
jgi:uncharacterized protein YmfQ (DUF2313 family)